MTDIAFPALRPMKLAELLDQAIRLYRRNFLQFIGIVAIPYIPLMLIQGLSTALGAFSLQDLASSSSPSAIFSSPNYWLGIGGSIIFLALYFVLVQGLATAALTRAIADSYTGKLVGIFSSYQRLRGSAGRLFWALSWMGLIALALLIWMIIPCVGWLSGPGFLIFVLWVVLPLVAPVVVLERKGAIASTRRAWDLGRTRFWWLIGYSIILYLFAALVINGPSVVVNDVLHYLLVQTPNSPSQQLILTTIVQSLVSMIAGLLYLPLQLSAITVVYFDLRVRSEGLDLALQVAPVTENAPIDLPEVVPTGPQSRLLTGTDIGNIILLTLAFIAIYILLITVLAGSAMVLTALFAPR